MNRAEQKDDLLGPNYQNWRGQTEGMHYLVRATKEYVVFIGKNLDLDWETSDDYDAALEDNEDYKKESHNQILNDVALIESTPCKDFPDETCISFKRLLGEAVTCALEHDYGSAKKMIARAQDYLRARSEEISRGWYLSASFSASAIIVFIGCLFWASRGSITLLFGPQAIWAVLMFTAGAIGALFSVIARSGKLRIDATAGKAKHDLEAMSRIIAGGISGIVVALAVNADIILTALSRGENREVVTILAALCGGAGERLATSIISKFESTHASFSANGDGVNSNSDKGRK